MKVICPESTCRAENDARTENCMRCQTPLRGYTQLLTHPAHLFNQGLALARDNHFAQARDLFAAVVYWCPMDLEARNALAMACLALDDLPQARHQWERVLVQSPADPLAKRGLEMLQTDISQSQTSQVKQQGKKPIKKTILKDMLGNAKKKR